MKAKLHILILTALVILAIVVGRSFVAEAQTAAAPKVVWEYKDGANMTVQQMNALGAEGWELCCSTVYGKDLYYIFKRMK